MLGATFIISGLKMLGRDREIRFRRLAISLGPERPRCRRPEQPRQRAQIENEPVREIDKTKHAN